jgi:hypothetical protein
MWCVIIVRLSRNQYLNNITHYNTENIVCTVGIGNCDNYGDSRYLLECHWDAFFMQSAFQRKILVSWLAADKLEFCDEQ